MPSTIAWLSNHTNGSLVHKSLWDARNGGGGLNRSRVPFGQSSVRNISAAPEHSADGLSLRLSLELSLEMTHDSRDDY